MRLSVIPISHREESARDDLFCSSQLFIIKIKRDQKSTNKNPGIDFTAIGSFIFFLQSLIHFSTAALSSIFPRSEDMRKRTALAWGVAILCFVVLMLVTPAIPQSQEYHDFADKREFVGDLFRSFLKFFFCFSLVLLLVIFIFLLTVVVFPRLLYWDF